MCVNSEYNVVIPSGGSTLGLGGQASKYFGYSSKYAVLKSLLFVQQWQNQTYNKYPIGLSNDEIDETNCIKNRYYPQLYL